MIPVFVTSVINRYDLLERMLASIDVPIGRGLIADNAISGWQPPAYLGPEWRVWSPPFSSLGWPGTLNFGILQTPDAPWWLFANNDVVFSPGDLAHFADEMATDEPRVVTFHFAVAAVNRAMVELVGLFDEWAFWPLYFDDQDYAYRCRLAGYPVIHRTWGLTEGADGFASSLTIASDPDLARANNRTWAINAAAYKAKWGGGPGQERFTTPWDSGLPLWATRPSIDGRAARLW